MRHCLLQVTGIFLARMVCSLRCAGVLLLPMLLPWPGMAYGDDVEKIIFLVTESDRVIAANAETGQFFDFVISAKEKIEQRFVDRGVAILVTNQRFAGVGAFPRGWSTTRRKAGETFISAEAADYSAVVVTSDRVLTFNGRTGAWSFTDR
ncbi:MAG: hypothetical protein OEU44_07860 [Gammaproteobacteria bacterium]|nr:hypothetical protein [Gammaproteobacteria bacterium]